MEEHPDRKPPPPAPGVYASWQRKTSSSKERKFNDWWRERDVDKAKVIDTLEAQIEDLQKKLEDGKRREEQLEENLEEKRRVIHRHEQEEAGLREMLYNQSLTHAETRQVLADTHTRYRAAAAQLERERDSAVVHVQRRMDTCRKMAFQKQKAFIDMKKQAKQVEQVVSSLRRELVQLEKGKKRVVENLKDELSLKARVIEKEKKGRQADKNDAILQVMELGKTIEKQAEQIKDVEKEKMSMNHLLVSTSKRCAALSNKLEEMEDVKERIRAAGREVEAEKEMNFLLQSEVIALRRKLECLEVERRTERNKFTEMREGFCEIHRQNEALSESKRHLAGKLMVSEKELKKKRQQTKTLETRLFRVNEDVESCARVLDQPKKLKVEVGNMKKNYPDSYEQVRLGEETKEDFQLRIVCLNKRLQLSQQQHDGARAQLRRLQRQLLRAQKQVHVLRVHFLRLLKEQKAELEHVRAELHRVKYHPAGRPPDLTATPPVQPAGAEAEAGPRPPDGATCTPESGTQHPQSCTELGFHGNALIP